MKVRIFYTVTSELSQEAVVWEAHLLLACVLATAAVKGAVVV